jgi:hypothetical protein
MDPVFAYIDVGSGSLIIQAAIAALVAAPFILRTQIARFVGKLRGENAEQVELTTATEAAAPAASDADHAG